MDINEFKAHFKYGGSRASNFRVTFTNPIDGSADNEIRFLAKASSLPATHLNRHEIPYVGRTIKVAGKKIYDDWSVQIYNDEDFKIRETLETWANFINTGESNIRAGGSSEVAAYKADGQVEQLSQTGAVLRTYRFVGIFPISISQINLDFGDDSPSLFETTFSFDYFTLVSGPTGDGGYV